MKKLPSDATIVLVHAAWADASSWSAVIGPLLKAGIKVIAAQIPMTSLSDDVAALKVTLERADEGPILLVSHSYSGAVITALEGDSRIRGLAYVAAMPPAEGETVGDLFFREAPHEKAPHLEPDTHGFLWMSEEGMKNAVAHRATAEQNAIRTAAQRPIAMKCLGEAIQTPAWRTKPSWYLLAEDDRMFSPKTQRFVAERMNAQIRAHHVDHAPQTSSPATVVEFVLEAAGATLSESTISRANNRMNKKENHMTTYQHADIEGYKIFYREAGSTTNPTIVLLHGFPSSSHMFRDLIPQLAGQFHVIAPDYLGFGYSDAPSSADFEYTFDSITAQIEELLFTALGLKKFSIYVQDYGAPVGFRIASRHPEAIEGIVVQSGNAYVEGISAAFEPLQPFWAARNEETEKAPRSLLTKETTIFQYTHGAKNVAAVSPDSYTFDQALLDRPGNDAIQLDLLHNYTSNLALYDAWHEYFRKHQPRTLIVWGQNDPFFIVPGAQAFLRDLPQAELHLIEGGHFVLEEHSEMVADKIIGFLGKGQKAEGSR
jgi:pimeloyl-ACP methyl ester carboxylesterase